VPQISAADGKDRLINKRHAKNHIILIGFERWHSGSGEGHKKEGGASREKGTKTNMKGDAIWFAGKKGTRNKKGQPNKKRKIFPTSRTGT